MLCSTQHQLALQPNLLPRLETGHLACPTQTLTQHYLLRAVPKQLWAGALRLLNMYRPCITVTILRWHHGKPDFNNNTERGKWQNAIITQTELHYLPADKLQSCCEVNQKEMKLPKTCHIDHACCCNFLYFCNVLAIHSCTNVVKQPEAIWSMIFWPNLGHSGFVYMSLQMYFAVN